MPLRGWGRGVDEVGGDGDQCCREKPQGKIAKGEIERPLRSTMTPHV